MTCQVADLEQAKTRDTSSTRMTELTSLKIKFRKKDRSNSCFNRKNPSKSFSFVYYSRLDTLHTKLEKPVQQTLLTLPPPNNGKWFHYNEQTNLQAEPPIKETIEFLLRVQSNTCDRRNFAEQSFSLHLAEESQNLLKHWNNYGRRSRHFAWRSTLVEIAVVCQTGLRRSAPCKDVSSSIHRDAIDRSRLPPKIAPNSLPTWIRSSGLDSRPWESLFWFL